MNTEKENVQKILNERDVHFHVKNKAVYKVDTKDKLKEWDRISLPFPIIDLAFCPLKKFEAKLVLSHLSPFILMLQLYIKMK